MSRRSRPDRPKGLPTGADVAQLAGVSQSAVSRAFRTGGSVAPATRKRIEEAADRLRYRPDALARAVATRRSGVIGLLISRETSVHFPEVLLELIRALRGRGLAAMPFVVVESEGIGGVLDDLCGYRLDGVISACHLANDCIGRIREAGIPLVLYNRRSPDHSTPSVSCDHEACGRLLAARLRERGHAKVALIEGPEGSTVCDERIAGFLQGFGKPPAARVRADLTYATGAEAMRQLLATGAPFSAVVAASDMMALGAADAAGAAGIAIPQRLVIAGFDGIPAASWGRYAIATVQQPVPALARAAADLMASAVNDPGQSVERRMLCGELQSGIML